MYVQSPCCWRLQQCYRGGEEMVKGMSFKAHFPFLLNKKWTWYSYSWWYISEFWQYVPLKPVSLNSRHCTSTGQKLGHVLVCHSFLMFCKHLTTKAARSFGHLAWITFNQFMWTDVSTHSHSEMLAAKSRMFCHRNEWLNVVMSGLSDSSFFLIKAKMIVTFGVNFLKFNFRAVEILYFCACSV